MSTPDVTPTQYGVPIASIAAVLAIVYQAPDRLQIPLLVVLGGLGLGWLLSDAIIRHGRSGAVAAQHALATAQIQSAPDHVDTASAVAPAA